MGRNHLARAYLDDRRIREAIAIYEPLLVDRTRILGNEHADTLFTRNNLARAYLDDGRVGEAIAILEPLLADRERCRLRTRAGDQEDADRMATMPWRRAQDIAGLESPRSQSARARQAWCLCEF